MSKQNSGWARLIWVVMAATFLGCAAKRGVELNAAATVVAKEDKTKPEQSPIRVVPDIQISLVGESLDILGRTQNPSPKIQVDVHGAVLGVEFQLTEHRNSCGHPPFSCHAVATGLAKEQHQRWECMPMTLVEGKGYRLRVEAHGEHGNAIKKFSWVYDTTPLDVDIRIEDKAVWGRDDELHVQLTQPDAGKKYWPEHVHWEQTELLVGENQQHRAARTACPRSLPAQPYSQCFKVSLSALEDLPHGPYQLRLTATFTDETGNRRSRTQSFVLRISRELWSLVLSPDHAIGSPSVSPVVTREGLLLVVTRPFYEGRLKFSVVALNAQGEEVWKTKASSVGGQLLLGNHRGLDVVVARCTERDGFLVFNAKTGETLLETCSKPNVKFSQLALLQGGADKDLVVVRGRVLETISTPEKNEDVYALEACRFSNAANAWSVECCPSAPLSRTGSYYTSEVLVRQTPEGVARVFLDSLERYWCALEWKDKEGWSPGCVAQGPVAVPELRWPRVQVLGAEHLWVKYNEEGSWRGNGWQRFELNAHSTADAKKSLLFGIEPLLVDAGEELIALTNEGDKDEEKKSTYVLWRYSVAGTLLSKRTQKAFNRKSYNYEPGNMGLMEGGMLLFPSKEAGVLCLKPDLKDCWEGANGEANAEVDAHGSLLGILPLSPTRSVVVFGHSDIDKRDLMTGFLVDSPSLKKDAPWPLWGHDLCRTFNASVPIDNCWDGPKP